MSNTNFMKDAEGRSLIELGTKYKHKLHGFEGVATCVSRHVTGCDRVCLERMMPDGTVKDFWVDVLLVEGIEIPDAEVKSGGPQRTPPALSGEG